MTGSKYNFHTMIPLFPNSHPTQAADHPTQAPDHVAQRPVYPRPEIPNVARLVPPAVTSRAEYEDAHDSPAVIKMQVCPEELVGMLTACLDDAPCRESARVIYRALYRLALSVAADAGQSASTTRVVFHLVAELVMNYCGLKKSAFYDNLLYLKGAGLVAYDAHMGNLRGKSVATGTLWAVSLHPDRILNGQAAPMRLLADDWACEWRDLNADVRAGRTAYRELNPRPVVTVDAVPHSPLDTAGESRDPKARRICFEDLSRWATKPNLQKNPNNLTIRHFPNAAQHVVWELGDAALASTRNRAAIIDTQARTLAAAFGDSRLGFWRRFLWNLTRGIDSGVDLALEAGTILARVLGDLRHDIQNGGTPPNNPAAKANKALADIQAHLKIFQDQKVGVRPEFAA